MKGIVYLILPAGTGAFWFPTPTVLALSMTLTLLASFISERRDR